MRKISIAFLKKKRYEAYLKLGLKIPNPKAGDVLFFKYIALDRDLLCKYKLYGVCIGKKKNLIMTTFFLRTLLAGSLINLIFYACSPFVYESKLYKQKQQKRLKSKLYSFVPKLRTYQKFLEGAAISLA